MARAASRAEPAEDAPPVDPHAVERAYRRERAKRRARVERARERRRAAIRFFAFLLGLVALSVFLVVTIWNQIQRLFGL